MAKKKKPETLEEIAAARDESEKEIRYWEHQEKILNRKIQKLTRDERTHQLCTRGGMVNSFLGDPMLITDDQVMELLKMAFRQPEIKQRLEEMLKSNTS